MTVTHIHPEPEPEPDDRRLPHDAAAERSVLGACMQSLDALTDCVDAGLTGGDFYRPAHETIWNAICSLVDGGQPLGVVSLAAELNRRGDLMRVGGTAAVHDIYAEPTTTSNAAYYAKIVRDAAMFRGLVNAGLKIQAAGRSGQGDPDGVVSAAVAALESVTERRVVAKESSLADVADQALAELETGIPAVPSPWADLNDIIRGLQPGCLYATGARPGAGKTIVGVQWACHYADLSLGTDGPQVVYFTFEMSAARLYRRALATKSGVSIRNMLEGRLSDEELRRTLAADGPLRTLPLTIEAANGWTAQQVRARVRQLHRRRPVGLVVVDHIGLTKPDRSMGNRQMEISEAADVCLGIAHETEAAVHIMTQLNRGPSQRQEQRPIPSDIRDSDRIEQNADVLMMLHRDKEKAPDELHMGVPKNRDGEENSCRLRFEGHRARVLDWLWSPQDGAR